MARLCLDHAHCESVEHGTSGRYAFESDIELAICQFAQEDLINIGHQVMLTKETGVSGCTRLQMAIDWTAKIFLTVHVNSAAAIEEQGMGVFTSRGHDISNAFADILEQELTQMFYGFVRRGLKEPNFEVLNGPFPSALVKWDFVLSLNENAMRADVINQRACGTALARAIQRFIAVH